MTNLKVALIKMLTNCDGAVTLGCGYTEAAGVRSAKRKPEGRKFKQEPSG